MRNWLLLDSCSSVNLCCNKDILHSVKRDGETLELQTNGGTCSTDQKATLPGFGEVWYDPNSMTNVLSLGLVSKMYRVTMDSNKDNAMIVHCPWGKIRFTCCGPNIYKCDIRTIDWSSKMSDLQLPKTPDDDACIYFGINFLETVAENMRFYTTKQTMAAKRGRTMLHATGHPTVEDLKKIIMTHQIRNCPVTLQDINMAEKIFGKDVGTLKGKTERRKPIPVVSNFVEVPRELYRAQKHVQMAIDTMFVNRIPFLTTVSRNLLSLNPLTAIKLSLTRTSSCK